MDSRDSGCFTSILSNNTNISNIIRSDASYSESTPIKNTQNQTRPASHSRHFFNSPDSSCFTPIKSRLSDVHSQCSIDVDSVYFSQKRFKHSSQQCSPVSSFSQRLRLSSYVAANSQCVDQYSSVIYSNDLFAVNKIDFLTELNEKSMYHVIKQIMAYLPNSDYVRLSRVSKSWLNIYNNDLKLNKPRRHSLRQEIDFYKSEKVSGLSFYFNCFVGYIEYIISFRSKLFRKIFV